MPAGPAPTMTTSTLLSACIAASCRCVLLRFVMEFSHAALRADRHAFGDRHETALPVRHTVDFDETFEAHTHHAIRRTRRAADGRRAKPVDAAREQRSGDAHVGKNVQRAAIERNGDGGYG